eukprot:scaffold137172_cov37-Tisochrysis_lutea.AAC.1
MWVWASSIPAPGLIKSSYLSLFLSGNEKMHKKPSFGSSWERFEHARTFGQCALVKMHCLGCNRWPLWA